MKRLDEHKASLVEFLRSIRYPHHRTNDANHDHYDHDELPEHFAGFNPKTRSAKKGAKSKPSTGDKSPIRSAN